MSKYIIIYETEEKLENVFLDNEESFEQLIKELKESKTKYSYFILHY